MEAYGQVICNFLSKQKDLKQFFSCIFFYNFLSSNSWIRIGSGSGIHWIGSTTLNPINWCRGRMLNTCVTVFRNTNNIPLLMNELPKLSQQESTYSSIAVHVLLFPGTGTTCHFEWMNFQNSRNRSLLIAALLYMCGCFQEHEQHATLNKWASKTLGTGVCL